MLAHEEARRELGAERGGSFHRRFDGALLVRDSGLQVEREVALRLELGVSREQSSDGLDDAIHYGLGCRGAPRSVASESPALRRFGDLVPKGVERSRAFAELLSVSSEPPVEPPPHQLKRVDLGPGALSTHRLFQAQLCGLDLR